MRFIGIETAGSKRREKMRFSTEEYEFSHNRKPRGFGMWMFSINDKILGWTGTLTEAKNKARAKAKEIGNVYEIKVLP